MKEYLLTDEKEISEVDYLERNALIDQFKQMPVDFFSKLRHFQPQIGCLNACSICSKHASTNMNYWTEKRIRNVISALKYSTPRTEKPLIVWDRDNHRSGVIFSYLDNDVSTYKYFNKFIELAYEELGVKTRISTVGFSRHNVELCNMHRIISQNTEALGGVRLSFTPYSVGWVCQNDEFNRDEYIKDIATFLKIYKPYYDSVGSGSRNFCVELRYKPLVVNSDVSIFKHEGKFIIYTDDLLYVSSDNDITFEETNILDPYVHRLKLNNEGIKFNKIKVEKNLNSKEEIIKYLSENPKIEKEVEIYKTTNKDGEYYSVDPIMTDEGTNGYVIYPKTVTRGKSGYIINDRFFLNALFKYKNEHNIVQDTLNSTTWDDVYNVLRDVIEMQKQYEIENDVCKANYVKNEIIPMITAYIEALKIAGYDARSFFDKNFTIDTGIICNLGRAIHEFKGLVSYENEPLTLNHERNYGSVNSTMTKEGVAWRISCNYNDKLLIEELDLGSTATQDGQQRFYKDIQLKQNDVHISFSNLKNSYFIPGQTAKPAIKFYKEFGELGYLATYSQHSFTIDEVLYKTSEHYYQSKKFLDKETIDRVIAAESPKEASNIGRDRNNKKRDDWREIKKKIMFDAVYFKFKQNPDIMLKLLETGDLDIIEETVKENYWGCGPNYDGENNYGKILCKVRERLREEMINYE